MNPLQHDGWQVCPGDIRSDARTTLRQGGELRVVVLSSTMARVTYQPVLGFKEPKTWAVAPVSGQDVPWQGRNRDSLDGFQRPVVHSVEEKGVFELRTDMLRVRLLGHDSASPRLSWFTPSHDQPMLSDRETTAYMYERRTGLIRHCVQRNPVEHYFGLGDKTGPLNLHGRRLRTLGQDALGYDPKTSDPLYKHWPFLLQRTPCGRWLGMYYDTLSSSTFDLGCEHDNYHGFFRSVDIDDGDLDYYLMVGDSPQAVVSQFVQLIGGTHLPPKWSLGYAQTAMGLADAPDAQVQLDRFIDDCQYHQVPIAAFHYGSGYSSRGKQRYVFTWNDDKFPDPQAINARFQSAGMRLVANLKPCLLDDHPAFNSLTPQFIQNSDTSQPVIEPYWDGQGAHLDFTQPATIAWWQQRLREQIIDKGIDSAWNDNNEYAIQNDDAFAHGWGDAMPLHRCRPLHGMLMTRASFEAQQQHAAQTELHESVFTVTRAGGPGIQRYAQTWSGDNTTSWDTLRWNIRTGLQMSLSGMFNTGHDVGGFYGPLPEPELFVRWVQACSLNPRMVMNSWKDGGASNLPWMHAEVTSLVLQAINLRYQLLPYLWRCFELASAQHVPIIRPTFFNFPHDEQCLQDCDDFMLGEHVLVAPVVEQGMVQRQVYLPLRSNGSGWVNFFTRSVSAGGQWVTVDAPLSCLPLWVAQGAVIDLAVLTHGQVARVDGAPVQAVEF
jgi:alpha-glucosidase